MEFSKTLVAVVFAGAAVSAKAWDGSGHRVVGEIAFLTLQKMHSPAVQRLQAMFSGAGLPVMDLANAATVPDQIKQAKNNRSGYPTDTQRKYNHFHFVDQPIPSSAHIDDEHPGENALSMLDECGQKLSSTQDPKQQVWYVSWIAHLVGDIHQPLHASTHVWPGLQKGDHSDQGGNLFYLEGIPDELDPWKHPHPKTRKSFFPKELHAYWDGLVKGGGSDTGAERVARRLMDAYPMSGMPQSKLKAKAATWVKESYGYAKTAAYTSDLKLYNDPGETYKARATKLAEQRVALAGYRLAIVLDRLLR